MTDQPRLLLIGGTGFLGRHVCEAAERRGVAATTASRTPDTDFLKAHAPSVDAISIEDIDTAAFQQALGAATHVVYMAHAGKPSAAGTLTQDIHRGFTKLSSIVDGIMQAETPPHLVYLSSGGQIYGRVEATPIKEDVRPNPVTRYGATKLVNETLLAYLSLAEGLSTTVLRLGNPVGRWQLLGSHGLVSAAVRAAMTDTPLTIFGSGDNVRDYFDADDFAEFVVSTTLDNAWMSGVYNVGSGEGHTETDIIGLVGARTGRPVRHGFQPARKFDMPYAVLDSGKAEAELGWSASTPLEATIDKLTAFVTAGHMPDD